MSDSVRIENQHTAPISPESAISKAFQGQNNLLDATHSLLADYAEFCRSNHDPDARGNFVIELESKLEKSGILNELSLTYEKEQKFPAQSEDNRLDVLPLMNQEQKNALLLNLTFEKHGAELFKSSFHGDLDKPISMPDLDKMLARIHSDRMRQRAEANQSPLAGATRTLLENKAQLFRALDTAQHGGTPDGLIDYGDLFAFQHQSENKADPLSALVTKAQLSAVDQLVQTFYPKPNRWQMPRVFGNGQAITETELALRLGYTNVSALHKGLAITEFKKNGRL